MDWISNGSMKQGVSFLDSVHDGMFLIDNHTFWPGWCGRVGTLGWSATHLFCSLVLSRATQVDLQKRQQRQRWCWTERTAYSPSVADRSDGSYPSEASNMDRQVAEKVVGKLHPEEMWTPQRLVRWCETVESGLQFLIGPLCLTIDLTLLTRSISRHRDERLTLASSSVQNSFQTQVWTRDP